MKKYEHEKRNFKREHELELAGPFLVVLSIMTVIAFLIPLRPETSMRERRQLKAFPAFSVQTLLSGEYFDEINAWFSDTFPGRELMLEISDEMDSLHGIQSTEVALTQPSGGTDTDNLDELLAQAEAAAAEREAQKAETPTPAESSPEPTAEPEEVTVDPDAVIEDWGGLNGEEEMLMYSGIVVIDGAIFSRMGFEQTAADHHVMLMNRAGDALAEKGIRFFNIPAPTGISVMLSSEILSELGSADQGKTLRYMFALENDNVGKVNAFNNLLAHNDEYLYYYTDHHWTALGAYYAYEAFCQTAGFEPVPLSEYTEQNMGAFDGTLAHSVASNKIRQDEMIAYVPPGNIRMEIAAYPNATTVIIDKSNDHPSTKYNCFINGDNPLTIITNDDLPDAPDCLVIKDSFGNPFTVYLTQHYHRVIVVDYRYTSEAVSVLAERHGVQDVILVQSIGVSQTRTAQYLLDNQMR
ncbi:MAG: hypothetical protein IJQ02_06905 [Oscillospiraceae bacterium]|nr:hypothetical protein [Oscillospiraceae bacterium]MBR0393436.1 hypothetical protein [Oscillospiraceae bacterium]